MSRAPRLPAALTILALIGVLSAGCGSSGPSGTAGGTDTAGKTDALSAQEKAVKFAGCMRANGVPHFPDPDAKGAFNFGVDVTPAVFQRAVRACKALEPAGGVELESEPPSSNRRACDLQRVSAHTASRIFRTPPTASP